MYSKWSILTPTLFLLITVLVPPGIGQDASPNLLIDGIAPAGTLVVDSDNVILVRIGNQGSLQNSGTVRLQVTSCDGQAMMVLLGETAFEPVEPGGETVVEFAWDGRTQPDMGGASRDPVFGSCQFTAVLRTAIQESDTRFHERNQMLFIEFYHYAIELGELRNHEAGAVADQSFVVRNLGNVRDTVRLELRNPTPGWRFWLSNYQLDTVPGSTSSSQRLFAQSPEQAASGDVGRVDIAFNSIRHRGGGWQEEPASFHVLGRYRHQLSVHDPQSVFSPGSRVFVPLSIRNDGPEADNVTVIVDSFDAIRVSQAETTPGAFRLEAGASETTTLEVALRTDAEAGSAYLRLKTVSQGNPRIGATRNLTISVRQEYAVAARPAESMPPVLRVRAGDQLNVRIRVTNEGNGPDRFRILPIDRPAAWNATSPEPSEAIPSGRWADLTIGFAVPPEIGRAHV